MLPKLFGLRLHEVVLPAFVVFVGLLLGPLLPLGGCQRSEEQDKQQPPRAQPAANESKLLRLRNVGLAYLEAERHADAAKTFEKLLQLIPEEPIVHANLGLIALRENKLEEAKAYLNKAAQLAPDDPDIALMRSQAAVYDGRDEIARKRLEHAVAKNPEHLRARWALLDVVRRDRAATGGDTALTHLNRLLKLAPQNVVVRLALARELLERGEPQRASEHLSVLDQMGIVSSPQAQQFLDSAKDRIEEGQAATARSLVIALNNVLKPSRAWQDSLIEVRGPPVPVADPIRGFLAYRVSEPDTGPRSLEVTYQDRGRALGLEDVEADLAVMVVSERGASPSIVAIVGDHVEVYRRGVDAHYRRTHRSPLEIQTAGSNVPISRILALDWNNDRRIDLVCGLADGSVRLCVQDEDGQWQSVPGEPLLAPLDRPADFNILLPWDADQDGDLDVLVGREGVRAALLRNNGDGTFTEMARDFGIARDGDLAFIDASIADLDEDGDMDLVAVDADGTILHFDNRRSGSFLPTVLAISPKPVLAITAADFDNDGWFDLVFVTSDGSCHIAANQHGTGFDLRSVGTVQRPHKPGTTIQHLDFDNDGWLDFLIITDGRPHLFRNTGGLAFSHTKAVLPPEHGVVKSVQVVDEDSDGDLDLFVKLPGRRYTLWDNHGANQHGWQQVQLEAIVQGGQRNNSFGIGGFIEIRAGRAYQKRLVQGPITHFGLGTFGPTDAIRVVWPNGVPQNILLPEPDQLIVEKQMLKGSCPFLLAYDGRRFEFVTDLLWRSPLGMKINAQTVAPISSTHDYVKIEGRQLQPRRGRYDLAITAALWETHFFDEVELWVVDHPAELEVFVDERFVAPQFPPFELHVVEALRTPVTATDHHGQDVLDLIQARDGRRLGGFAKGRYQGIAQMHYVELDLGPWTEPQAVKLIASGWIMPTNTSINVALGQGDHTPPKPLSVSVADGAGGWIEVIPNAGFPAGKHKTIVLDLSGLFPTSEHRLRLETNLEIYWDRIAFALGEPSFAPQLVTLSMRAAELEYLGFPTMSRRDEYAPELPDYSRPSKLPRWRDLHGYYTRYGDVQELLAQTDDRYVIMNAGDQIMLSFDAPPPPPDGWKRDFVLFTDGWVKDGDWNTVASMTVGPLPYHGMSSYPYPEHETPAELQPSHPDWRRYHTRYVTSALFRDRMRP